MKRVVSLSVLLAVMLLASLHVLVKNIERGGIEDEIPQHVTVQYSASPPIAETAKAVPELREDAGAIERDALRAENAALRSKIEMLEAARSPNVTAVAAFAVSVEMKEADVRAMLDRSLLLPNAKAFSDAVAACGAQETLKALKMEAEYFSVNARFRAKKTENLTRAEWHSQCWVPFCSPRIATLCDRLYGLQMPSSLVESFRNRLTEGL